LTTQLGLILTAFSAGLVLRDAQKFAVSPSCALFGCPTADFKLVW
jgi:hypothetical protein